MKKHLLFILLIAFALSGYAQQFSFGFDDGSMQGWTSIDADGDGYAWRHSSEVHLESSGYQSQYCVVSQTLDSLHNVLCPDDYLVSPLFRLGDSPSLRFRISLPGMVYTKGYFGVALSTSGNTQAEDFVTVYESEVGPCKEHGVWHEVNLDLQDYAHQDVYIAIRNFNQCSIEIDVDNITITLDKDSPKDFAPLGAEWYFNLSSFMGSPVSYHRMSVLGDTIIQGHNCSVISAPYLGGNGNGEQYVYQDNAVVYWYNQALEAFTTLYDFDAEAGESWICHIDTCSFEIKVKEVDTLIWEERVYRIQHVVTVGEENGAYAMSGRIINGIGYEAGLFPYPWACENVIYDGASPNYLRCYLENEELLYHEGEYDCDEYGFCWDGSIADAYAGGDGTKDNPYRIATSEQLALLAQQTNEGTGGDAYYKLTQSIGLQNCTSVNTVKWISIGTLVLTPENDTIYRPFKGHFDGNGHNIQGLVQLVDSSAGQNSFGGLFGCTDGAEINNVNLFNCSVKGCGAYVGGLVGYAGRTNIDDCDIRVSWVVSDSGVAGGLVGFLGAPLQGKGGAEGDTCRVSNCRVGDAVTIEGALCAGSIVGRVNNDDAQVYCVISDCKRNTCFSSFHVKSSQIAGGMVGMINNGSIVDCEHIGSVVCDNMAGGIVGEAKNGFISHCRNRSDISDATWCGGILGASQNVTITGSVNSGAIQSHKDEACLGGIAGGFSGQMANCYNRGAVAAHATNSGNGYGVMAVGGIAGVSTGKIFNVYNTGIVAGPDVPQGSPSAGSGSIVGFDEVESHYLNCYWHGNDSLSACGNAAMPDLPGSSHFRQGATSTSWVLDKAQYGTADLLEALNLGALVVLDSMPGLQSSCIWREDTLFANNGFPVVEPQSQPVTPPVLFPLIGSEWYYEIQNENGSITYQHLEYVADTTVNQKKVAIIIRTNTLYDKGRHETITHEYLYGEGSKIFWWNKTLNEFTVLYDFGVEASDTWEIKVGTNVLVVRVDEVGELEYNGRSFRTMNVSDEDHLFDGTIVCSVGHLFSFFPEKLMIKSSDYRVEGIRCYWEKGELLFALGGKDCDEVYEQLHHGLDETKQAGIVFYPNPASNKVHIEGAEVEEVQVYNVFGQLLKTGRGNEISVEDMSKGVYLLRVVTKEDRVETARLMVK